MHDFNSSTDDHGQLLSQCIQACSDCANTCEHMIFQHCLVEGGHHIDPDHLTLMADCVAICRTSASFMLRGSQRHQATCRLCAEICEACASSCELVGDMDDCVQACRQCADMCREMTEVGAN